MKTLLEKTKNIYISGIWLVGSLLFIAMLQSCIATYVPERTTTTVVRREVVPPLWAPPYDNVEQVHYYYIPDIEVYYDVWNHEYVYLHDGSWVFTSSYPTYYNQYDINSAFVVVLDSKVAEPWRRHQTYVSHYPRYYYKSVYERRDNNHDNYGGVRGFNENAKAPVYRNPRPTNLGNSRDNARPSNNNNNSGNYDQSNQRRTDNSKTEKNGRSYDTRQDANSNQQSGRDVPRSIDNSNTSGRRTDNNPPVNTNTNNSTRRTDNVQPTETRNERSSNERGNSGNTNVNPSNNSNATNSGQNAETQRRTQPAVYSGREVGQPVRVRREAQPAAREEKKKAEKQNTQKKDDSNTNANSSRR